MMSAGEAAGIRTDLLRLLNHSYSRTPITQGSQDAWGDAAATPGTVATAQPCLYSPVQTLRSDTGGRVTIDRPNIRVPPTDPLAVGDLVSAVVDQAGTSLVSGTFRVETLEPVAKFGFIVQKRAYLMAAQVAE